MRVLHVLTYFVPHVSGLTIHVERLTRLLAARGSAVTVLTSQHRPELPARETKDGVQVVRVPVLLSIGKGVVMPTFGAKFRALAPENDVIHLHVPQLEAGAAAHWARRKGLPVVVTVHCDLVPAPGLLAWFSAAVVERSGRRALQNAGRIVTYTEDYLFNTPIFAPHLLKCRAILPPTESAPAAQGTAVGLRLRHGISTSARVIGFAARWAADKGIETLLTAVERLRREKRAGEVVLLCAGPREETRGEQVFGRLKNRVRELGEGVVMAGTLGPEEMHFFYEAIDVLAVPSVNRTESFGLVQVEAQRCGVPVVASALPGVRTVVSRSHGGLLVPPGDPEALAAALAEVLAEPIKFRPDRDAIAFTYDSERIAGDWERLYAEVVLPHRTDATGTGRA